MAAIFTGRRRKIERCRVSHRTRNGSVSVRYRSACCVGSSSSCTCFSKCQRRKDKSASLRLAGTTWPWSPCRQRVAAQINLQQDSGSPGSRGSGAPGSPCQLEGAPTSITVSGLKEAWAVDLVQLHLVSLGHFPQSGPMFPSVAAHWHLMGLSMTRISAVRVFCPFF